MRLVRAIASAAGVVVFVLLTAAGAWGLEPGERLPDPAMEARAREISAELRCLVCQNQSIDDSNAELAKDLRLLVRERLVAGDSNRQVLDFVVERYGEFVLLKPPINLRTLLLWLTPLLTLLGILAYVAPRLRRSYAAGSDAPEALTDAERLRLQELIGANQRSSEPTKDETHRA